MGKMIAATVGIQQRNLVIMEVNANLIKEDRAKLLSSFTGFKKVAMVVCGEPNAPFKKITQAAVLKDKQAKADIEFKKKLDEEKRKKLAERKVRQETKWKKKEEKKKKKEEEIKKKEAAAAAEERKKKLAEVLKKREEEKAKREAEKKKK